MKPPVIRDHLRSGFTDNTCAAASFIDIANLWVGVRNGHIADATYSTRIISVRLKLICYQQSAYR